MSASSYNWSQRTPSRKAKLVGTATRMRTPAKTVGQTLTPKRARAKRDGARLKVMLQKLDSPAKRSSRRSATPTTSSSSSPSYATPTLSSSNRSTRRGPTEDTVSATSSTIDSSVWTSASSSNWSQRTPCLLYTSPSPRD